jgi:Lrp/AsnC family transcriptional regulator for asnA, asnC and gidA
MKEAEIRCWRKESCNDLLDTLQVDDLDMQIIQILSENARKSNVEIAHKIGVSEGTVRRRISEMVKKGIIEGFILLLNCKESEKCVKAFVSMKVDDAYLNNVIDGLLQDHERIIVLYRTNTKYNILCEVMFPSVMEMQEFIDKISTIENIIDFKVKMVVGSYKKCLWTGI